MYSTEKRKSLKLLPSQEHRKCQNKSKASRRKEIKTKTRAEMNELEKKKTIEIINETKSCFFENIKEIDKPLARLKKEKKTQINSIMNEPGGIKTDPVDIRRIRKYYKQLCSCKFNNIDKKGHFVKKQSQFIQYDIDNLNSPVIIGKLNSNVKHKTIQRLEKKIGEKSL